MDENILRFILFLIAIVVVLGIYFRERHKRINQRVQQIRNHNAPEIGSLEDVETPAATEVSAPAVEQEASPVDADAAENRPEDGLAHEVQESAEPPALQEPAMADETVAPAREASIEAPENKTFKLSANENEPVEIPSIQLDTATEQKTTGAAEHLPEMNTDDDYLAADLPNIIMQINIAARSRPFTAAEIWQCAKDVELEYGDMPVFHRYASGSHSKVVFSMANLFEPGSLPEKANADFETKGLSLFAQFPGPEDSLATFSDMLFTAERIGAMLDAELQDDSHSALTRQTIEHMREQLIQHRMQVQLARKKRLQ
ncbi:MAG: hypothetical protein KZQ58_10500 [gamma proteobacterium symbiont of Bathyaustriella thionipta]|nr:hypothetical protein [gamma proteobacterium symbiont of Bathyaustriella thionipta]